MTAATVGLLEHHLRQPDPIGVGPLARPRPAREAAFYPQHTRRAGHLIHRRAWPAYAMVAAMVKPGANQGKAGQGRCAARQSRARRSPTCCPRPAARPSAASASSSPRWSAAGARSSANAMPGSRAPESIRFPPGKKSRRRADPGRRGRACADDAACRAADRRAGQPLLRLSGGRAGPVPPGRGPGSRRARKPRPAPAVACGRLPAELGDSLREIADPELRACLESLARGVAASDGASAPGGVARHPSHRQNRREEEMKH